MSEREEERGNGGMGEEDSESPQFGSSVRSLPARTWKRHQAGKMMFLGRFRSFEGVLTDPG